MKEYDQFMQQVKGKKKTEAPVDTFGKEWTKKDKLGNPDYNVGYDPNYRLSAPDPNSDFNSENKPTRKFSSANIQDNLEALRKRIVGIKDPEVKDRAFKEVYLKQFDAASRAMDAKSREEQEEQALWRNLSRQGYRDSEIPALIQQFRGERQDAMRSRPLFNPRGR
jgi:hypothetical protein